MRLSQFFQEPYIERALDAYVLARPDWNINAKIDLYSRANTAFDPERVEAERRASFRVIYDELKSYWKVFRNARDYWDSDTTYTSLFALTLCTRDSGLTLATLNKDTHGAYILRDLMTLRDLKQNQAYPYMAVSKFLHFYNPSLFPIFDTDAIWYTVCDGVFKNDYRDFCQYHGFNPNETTGRFNLNYTLWASEMIQGADPSFMQIFAEWTTSQLGNSAVVDDFGGNLDIYFATAFEFVAIGAAQLEKDNRSN